MVQGVRAILFFDFEFYPEDRADILTSFQMRPTRESHIILGGSMTHIDPFNPHPTDFRSYWIWDREEFTPTEPLDAERLLLTEVYTYFTEVWEENYRRMSLKYGSKVKPQLLTCGTGISRADLPILFVRSLKHGIADADQLYQTFLTTTPIDLTNVAVPLMRDHKNQKLLKPIPTSDILQEFGMGTKKEGRSVWELYETRRYTEIELRTRHEVEQNIELFIRMREQILQRTGHILPK